MTVDASASTRALAAFRRLSRGDEETTVALRALTLHMLAGLAPEFFARRRLRSSLDASIRALRSVPTALDADLEPDVMMARLDALYVRALHGDGVLLPPAKTLAGRIAPIHAQSRLYGWLLAQLAAKLGRRTVFAEQTIAECCITPIEELYFATHELLLAGDYCARPLDAARFVEHAALLKSRIKFVINEGELDVGAEIGFCLAMLGRRHEAMRLTNWLRRHQQPNGAVSEPASERFDALHTTAAAVLAFAAVEEMGSAAH